MSLRASLLLPVLLAPTVAANAQAASVAFEDSIAVYGPEVFPALTLVRQCDDFRVLVAYVNGTDLLFVDQLVPAEGGSTYRAGTSFGFVEFNHYEASRSVNDIACAFQDTGRLRISGTGFDGHAGENFKFTIVLDTRTGQYRYSDSLD